MPAFNSSTLLPVRPQSQKRRCYRHQNILTIFETAQNHLHECINYFYCPKNLILNYFFNPHSPNVYSTIVHSLNVRSLPKYPLPNCPLPKCSLPKSPGANKNVSFPYMYWIFIHIFTTPFVLIFLYYGVVRNYKRT